MTGKATIGGRGKCRVCVLLGMLFATPVAGAEVRELGLRADADGWARLDHAVARTRAARSGDANAVAGTWRWTKGSIDLRWSLALAPEGARVDARELVSALERIAGVTSALIGAESAVAIDGRAARIVSATLVCGNEMVEARIVSGDDLPQIHVFAVRGRWSDEADAAIGDLLAKIEIDEARGPFDRLAAQWLWVALFAGAIGVGLPQRRSKRFATDPIAVS